MCGIAGYIEKQPRPAALSRMLAGIAHRGPDGEGEWRGEGGPWRVSLGHRRLAIIDLLAGAQPMGNADDSLIITYNGEVYNFLELRARLEREGHVFKNHSDTEVIVHHFEQHGEAGLPDLNGMFAFALWNVRTKKLVLARDRMGIKPLYYATLPEGGIVFASELSALLAHGGVDAELSVEGVCSYFFSDYVHPPHSIVRRVRKLPPGYTVAWVDGRLEEPRPFWRPSAPAPAPEATDQELSDQLWRGLERAVDTQLIADVPVGIFLSGGIDSSIVATLAARKAGSRMKAFSIGFENPTFDESQYARLVAERLNVEHVIEHLRERDLLDVVDVALDKLDEPMADPSFLPTFVLSRLAAKHVKVVVGGDGGDELWGGYPTYRAHVYAALYARIPAWLRNEVVPRALEHLPIDDRYQSLEWKLRRFTERWDDDDVTRHLRWMSSIDRPDLPLAIRGAEGVTPPTLNTVLPATGDRLARLMLLDLVTYMPGSVLAKVDRASMAHGLEVRPPFLDNDLAAWALSLPSTYKVRRDRGKFLLKLAAKGKLPDAVIERPKKGFGIPLAAWLRGPLQGRIEDVLKASPIWDTEILNRSVFQEKNREHQTKQKDNSKPLWALFVLDRWLRRTRAALAA
ncbi:MAG TPA: asparagine synthase (glutamine-hydrolyzing) [Polyangiaceae bacterium]|nr:asparagine synthase (glutamine-hydrolyzing) [Polyangiaceae bacterium]